MKVIGNDGRPLTDAVVYAVPATPVPRAKLPSARIDQIHRQFVPRVNVIQVGTSVDFPNSDNIRHSVYSFSPAKTFLLKLYAGETAPAVTFDKPGIVVLGCEIHDSMIAWLLVVDTPYYGKSDAHGFVVLRNLLAGNYSLHAWHEPLREATASQPLRVVAGAPLPGITVRLNATATTARVPAMSGMPGM
ncbi:MAG: methylamine utilization protein [Steroidobacteraceae bacterium]